MNQHQQQQRPSKHLKRNIPGQQEQSNRRDTLLDEHKKIPSMTIQQQRRRESREDFCVYQSNHFNKKQKYLCVFALNNKKK